MATNNLTPEQDLLVREFYVEIGMKADDLFAAAPTSARNLRSLLLELLNYDQIANGAYITKGTVVKMEFGTKDLSAYPDEWAADYDRSVAAIALGETDEADSVEDDVEASTGSPSSNTSLRETLFPKDV